MRHYTEGLVFIPHQRAASRRVLVERVLAFIGGPQHIVNQEADLLYTNTHNLSLLEILEQISQSNELGSFKITLGGFTGNIYFLPREQDYAILRLDIDKYAFREIEGDPFRVEPFAAAWLQFCQAMQANAAVFSAELGWDSFTDIEKRLTALRDRAIATFVSNVDWRTYLEPELGRLWREQEQEPERYYSRVEELPSGALVIWAGMGYNPELGNGDALYNARFLLEQLQLHPEVVGVERLLEMLHLEEKRLLRIEDDADYLKHGKNRFYDKKGFYEARAILDEIRATWACALQRPGLVGVQQIFAGEKKRGDLVVPVVADEGCEWILATLLDPFDLSASAWTDPQTGLQARVHQLVEAAQQHPVDGKPPRVLVYFWRGVQPAVRHALVDLGAHVEVADHLPLLQKPESDA